MSRAFSPEQPFTLTAAISSRALFDLEDSHAVFDSEGTAAYEAYQIEREHEPLAPGVAFNMVRKLLALNTREPAASRVEVVLLSRNSADTGLRVFNAIDDHGLDISRAAFTGGRPVHGYLAAFGATIFLSADAADVRAALQAGVAAATIVPARLASASERPNDNVLRLAFDGDSVLFSDQAELVYQRDGLDAFSETEKAQAHTPLEGGPFRGFLAALHALQSAFPADDPPLRTALVTARGAPAHERVVRTLRAWQIRIDEAMFLGGMPKVQFLREFGADLFFDDQQRHVDAAAELGAAHVPHGVMNDG